VNGLFPYALMLDSLIVTCVQFTIMLIELQKVLHQKLKCLCSKTTTILSEWTKPKTVDVCLLHFYCIRGYIYGTEMYIYCIYSTYIL